MYVNVLGIASAVGLLFWLIDGYFEFIFFHQNLTFLVLEGPETLMESLVFQVPMHSLFVRLSFVVACVICGFIVAVFLSRRKKTEALLKENEQKFRALIRTIPDLIWLKDQNGIYLACNSRFEHFFGAKEKDIIGKTDYDFLDKDLADSFRKHDAIVMAKGKPSINEEEIIFADDGHREILETIKTAMYSNDGQLAGVLGIGRNITERINLQAQFIQSQKMESVGRLAGGVAHDYNNISSIIMGYTELALEKIEQSDPLYDYLMEIYTASKRSTDITRQLLAFARQQTIAPIVLDLNDTIEKTLKMLCRLIGEDIDIKWFPKAELWPIKIDPSQINQILVNLCVNARDAIANVGKVSFETKNISFDEAYCADHVGFIAGEYVLLAVSDDGSGMSPKTLDKIFEPFFTTKGIGKGTGLGLSTVYGIVKQNNGFINVYSEPEKGTTFKIYLPRHFGDIGLTTHEDDLEIPLSRGELVLLVEDDPSILKLGERILTVLGYNILSTTHPTEAIQLANESPGTIDLLITDVVMPEMNGRELSEQLLSHHPNLKVLFMSGYTANVIAHRGVLEDGVHFISKPFSKKDLAVKAREVLDDTKGYENFSAHQKSLNQGDKETSEDSF
ncbi:MAG: response regulator [Proteobacteria bacterium]|nr:response regulator [Pseudomonadota bacterium]